MAAARDHRIRVLVVGLSTLVREMLVAQFDRDSTIELIEAAGEEPLGETIRRTGPDFAIVPLERSELLADARNFLAEQARARVVGLGEDERYAVIYELRAKTTELAQPTPRKLAAVMRAAARRER